MSQSNIFYNIYAGMPKTYWKYTVKMSVKKKCSKVDQPKEILLWKFTCWANTNSFTTMPTEILIICLDSKKRNNFQWVKISFSLDHHLYSKTNIAKLLWPDTPWQYFSRKFGIKYTEPVIRPLLIILTSLEAECLARHAMVTLFSWSAIASHSNGFDGSICNL